ncbi:efflux RND transporter periplasmic adaptor subunit [Rhodocaloribacter litoris]|uniref:efflux RND transporter periplasmic adaptor subunit n=1 Tax=Rhodocaloribacter litoris TaxID=2558931 RepID=UPI0014248C98|nr:efflux RND transporter periplasmic adaptor subunit [Rhodocaloribacter litoris]QXD13812.1 efflux RND transporter periplasmic adaptor subunit [Rhodocaloribacter litoris]
MKKLMLFTALLILTAGGFLLGRLTHPGTGHEAPPAAPDTSAGPAAAERKILYWRAPMDPNEIYDRPGKSKMGMDLIPVYEDEVAGEGTVTIDPVTMQNIGVRTARVEVTALRRAIRTTGRFVMDEQGAHTVSLKVGGWVEKLYVDFNGAVVRAGQPLLELYSPDLVTTQEEYLLAFRNARQAAGSSRPGVQADARRVLEAARRRLAYWDLSEEQIRRLETTGIPQRTITFFTPAAGEVMNKQVVEGQYVAPGQPLMDIVDISRIWLIVDVYEQDLAWVRPGTPAQVALPYAPGVTYTARVDHIYHMLDGETRAARARIVLPGGHHAPLKPGMYATVTLEGAPTAPSPVVPEEAVLQTGEQAFVVLALGGGRFRPVEVRVGLRAGGQVQILDGLQGGEEVVIRAQFLIDSEARLRSALGALAGHHNHGAAPAESGHAGHAPAAGMQAEGGVQVVRVTVGAAGFEPQRITLQAGRPARLVFVRTTDGTCATQVVLPGLGLGPVDLPLHREAALDFTPSEAGTFTFACGMEMLKGTLVVTR